MRTAAPELVDRLSIDYFLWHAYVEGRCTALADPVAVPRAVLDALASLSERFAALLDRTVARVLADPALLDFYALPADLRGVLGAPEPVGLARYDAFLTPGGWRFCEFNADVPGGVHEGAGLNDLVLRDPSRFRVVDRLADLLCRDRVRPRVALVFATGYGEDLEQCQFLAREWARRGLRPVLCSPDHLSVDAGRVAAFGEPVDALYRFFPVEWLPLIPRALEAFAAARDAGLPVVNGLSSLIAQSKKTMALWHERPELLTPEDRRLVRAHVPLTQAFRPDRLPAYRRERERWVVKRQFGRIGEEVLVGAACDDAEWAEWLRWPASEPDQWIAQERFTSLDFDAGGDAVQACFGPYVVGGRFAGLYNRFSPDGFITYDAYVGAAVAR